MTEKKSTLQTIEAVKSFAMALVGAGIFSMGSTYFSPQSAYSVPRILMPVYRIFGNVGLAIGMLVLGMALMYFAYKKLTKHKGRPLYLLAFTALAVVAFYAIIFTTSSKPATIDDVKASIENGQKKTQNQIANAERPVINSDLADTYLDNLEGLEKKFEKSVSENNKAQFDECEKEYLNLSSTELGKAIREMSGKAEYRDFIMYNAKITEKIDAHRKHKW